MCKYCTYHSCAEPLRINKNVDIMTQQNRVQLFEERKVRTLWDDEQEKWYFSIVDAVAILTDSVDPTAYWRKLKQRLKAEGNETVTNCHGLKMRAADGKMRMTDVADTEQLFRLIQSIPSPKAEPFKSWMARLELELKTGQKVVTSLNARSIHKQLETNAGDSLNEE